jgi:hypothetical protein
MPSPSQNRLQAALKFCGFLAGKFREPRVYHPRVSQTPQVIHPQRAVELLAAVEEVVRRGARGGEGQAEGVVVVAVGDRPRVARQEAHIPVAVVAVEARRPSAIDLLILADALQAIGVGAGDRAADHFVHHLRVARGIERIHQILGGGAAHRLRHPVAVAVVI